MSQTDTETETTDAETETEQGDQQQDLQGTRVAEETAPFEAIIEASTLEDFLAPLDALAREFRLQVTEEGFFTALVDPANIALAHVTLHKEAFEAYHIDGDGGMVGLAIEKIQDVLDFAESGDLVHLALNAETKKLDVEFDRVDASIACIDPTTVRTDPDIPAIAGLEVDVTLTGAQFKRSVDLCDMVSDQLIVAGDPENSRWLVYAEGDIDAVQDAYEKDDLIHTAGVPDDHETVVSVEYMQDMVGPIPKDAEVRLRHGDGFPVKWDYEMGEGAVSVLNMLAPRTPVR